LQAVNITLADPGSRCGAKTDLKWTRDVRKYRWNYAVPGGCVASVASLFYPLAAIIFN